MAQPVRNRKKTNQLARRVSSFVQKNAAIRPEKFGEGVRKLSYIGKEYDLNAPQDPSHVHEEARLQAASRQRLERVLRTLPDRANAKGLIMHEQLQILLARIGEMREQGHIDATKAHAVLAEFFSDYRPRHPLNEEHVAVIMRNLFPDAKEYHFAKHPSLRRVA